MVRIQFHQIDDFRRHEGEDLGVTEWYDVTQEAITQFAEVTGDRGWLHVDVERSRKTRFGGTIAHGYYSLGQQFRMLNELWDLGPTPSCMNYGIDRVRFPASAPVGSRIRLAAKLIEVRDIPKGIQIKLGLTFECDRATKPVCVAEWIGQFYEEPTYIELTQGILESGVEGAVKPTEELDPPQSSPARGRA